MKFRSVKSHVGIIERQLRKAIYGEDIYHSTGGMNPFRKSASLSRRKMIILEGAFLIQTVLGLISRDILKFTLLRFTGMLVAPSLHANTYKGGFLAN